MKKITLSIKDRMLLIGVLQSMEFDRLGATTINSIMSYVCFQEQETIEIELQNTSNGFIWNAQKALDKTIELSDEQVLMLKKSMTVMDERKKITIDLLPLDTKILQL